MYLNPADKRIWLLFAIFSVGIVLTFALFHSSSDVAKTRDKLKNINNLVLASQQLRIQYGQTKDTIATFMFLGSNEAWDDLQTEMDRLRSLSKTLTENKILQSNKYRSITSNINTDINTFIDKVEPLRKIRQDPRGVVSGVRASSDLQAIHNYQFISNISLAISLLTSDESDKHTLIQKSNLLEARYLWQRMLSEFRAYMLLRSKQSRDATLLYLDQFNKRWEDIIKNLSEEDFAIQEALLNADKQQQLWKKNLPTVIKVHANKRWRYDLQYYQDEILPVGTTFLTSLNRYIRILNTLENQYSTEQVSFENDVIIWASVFLLLISIVSVSLLILYNRLLNIQQQKRLDAERVSRMKSGFLSRMSHELRTPLNAIIGFGQLLSYDKSGKLSDEHMDYIQEINNASQHLLDLVNEVLDLSVIESGKVVLDMQTLELNTLVEECITLIRPMARQFHIQIIDEVNDKPPCMISADAMRLKQVLINLMSNAVKYNTAGGSMTLGLDVKEHAVRLNITDSGSGISDENLAKLFQPFERLGIHAEIDGTGMGLVISKELMHSMGGRIGVRSAAGNGSTFWIEFDLQPGETASS